MGQASSVQREPSMEEILASIRRIIEDSDASRKGTSEPEPAPRGAGSLEIAAFRTGLHEHGAAEAPQADLSEQFGAASGYPPAAKATTAPDFGFSVPEALRPENAAGSAGDEIEMELDIDGFEESGSATGSFASADSIPQEVGAEQRPAILSDHAGRQVAASFGELSDALAARSRKSFDQIAEEMLRPMLQDWLDNNLPHLVEKLVREEIERIARGSSPR